MNITIKIDIDKKALKESGMTKDQLVDELTRNASKAALATAYFKGLVEGGSLQETQAKIMFGPTA